MLKEPYYGPAGIFSTDDPGTDASQIAAEQGPLDEEVEELLDELAGGLPIQDKLCGCCPECIWWDSTYYRADDPRSLEKAEGFLRAEHHEEHPDCDGELEFASW